MFSYKFIVRNDKNDDLRLRITNNRQSAQFSLGLRLSKSELDEVISGTSGNIRFEKLLTSWVAQIKDLMLELSDKKSPAKMQKKLAPFFKNACSVNQTNLLNILLLRKGTLNYTSPPLLIKNQQTHKRNLSGDSFPNGCLRSRPR